MAVGYDYFGDYNYENLKPELDELHRHSEWVESKGVRKYVQDWFDGSLLQFMHVSNSFPFLDQLVDKIVKSFQVDIGASDEDLDIRVHMIRNVVQPGAQLYQGYHRDRLDPSFATMLMQLNGVDNSVRLFLRTGGEQDSDPGSMIYFEYLPGYGYFFPNDSRVHKVVGSPGEGYVRDLLTIDFFWDCPRSQEVFLPEPEVSLFGPMGKVRG